MSPHAPIDDRQCDAESGRLLRAYTAEYRRAKRFRGLRLAVSGLLAVLGPLVSLWSLDAAGVVGALAGAWVLLTRLVLIPIEHERISCAVAIQERFDTRLFDLPWPGGLAGSEPSEEDIADAARRLGEDDRVTAQHQGGWYPSTAGLRWPVDVLVAQWASAAYGRRQHRDYFWFLTTGAGLILLAVIVVGIALEMSLVEWLVTFLLPGLPALVDIGELADGHRRISDQRKVLESQIGDLWRAELTHPGTLSMNDCRKVQDLLFKLRQDGRQVPEWFYWLHRDRNEANMDEAAAARRTQYQSNT